MDTKVNYIIVGLFVSLLTLAVIGGTIWLAGLRSTKTYDTYITYMNEAVSGLSEKAPVKFNGVIVGFVEKIALNPQNLKQVSLLLKIQEGTPITEATRSSLLSQGLTGIAYIGLAAEKVQSPLLKKHDDEAYPVIMSTHSLFFRLDQTVEAMSKDVTSVAENLKQLLNEENQASVKASLENLRGITEAFNKNTQNINQTLQSMPQLIVHFESTLNETRAAVKSLQALSKQGNQSINDLSQETLPSVQQILIKLNHSLANVEQLTGDLNKNPSMLLRGRTPQPLGPGEK